MAYTTIDDPTIYFDTVLYTGNGASTPGGSGSTQTISSLDFAPDWVWLKDRTQSGHNHNLADTVRGTPNLLFSDATNAEVTDSTDGFTGFTSNGFTLGDNGEGTQSLELNKSGNSYVAWSWSAGGSAPAITYTVKVVSDGGNKYRFDDFGTSAVTLDLQEGGTYTFDQSDSSNSGHPLRFYTASDKSGGEYTTGVTTTGTAGSSGAKTVITVAASAPTLYYQCSNHAGMGGQANTNSTFGSSNFLGSIQSTVSSGITQGMSIVSYTGNGSNDQRIGHGLGARPVTWFIKNLSRAEDWIVYHQGIATNWYDDSYLYLNATNQAMGAINAGTGNPTSSVFYIGDSDKTGKSGDDYIAYVFSEKKGYSKFGSYTGNGSSSDGTFVYTGFRPAWIMRKNTDGGVTENWVIEDNKRNTFNPANEWLAADSSGAEGANNFDTDFCSNGFKMRSNNDGTNRSGTNYIYMAFAESPFVNSAGAVPTNAR